MAKSTKSPPFVRSIIVCEDVRQETNGKEILIGVYNDSIISKTMPLTLQRFVLRVAYLDRSNIADRFRLLVKDPNGVDIIDVSGSLSFAEGDDYRRIFGVQAQNVSFGVQGTYEICVGFISEPVKVSDFDVRLPVGESEKRRLS